MRLLEYDFSRYALVLCAYEAEEHTGLRQALAHFAHPESIALVIGPEGGFAPHEIEALTQIGAQSVSLGPRILRTETASPALLAAVLYHYGQWEAQGR